MHSQSQNNFKEVSSLSNNLKNSASLNYNMNHQQQQQQQKSHHQTHINNLKRVKKHLEFNGPECWINFKFDYDAISQILPQPLLDL